MIEKVTSDWSSKQPSQRGEFKLRHVLIDLGDGNPGRKKNNAHAKEVWQVFVWDILERKGRQCGISKGRVKGDEIRDAGRGQITDVC